MNASLLNGRKTKIFNIFLKFLIYYRSKKCNRLLYKNGFSRFNEIFSSFRVFFFKFVLCVYERGDYDKYEFVYVRDCYYRLISEILLLDYSKFDRHKKLAVVGSPGIGKSCLLFLFIRVLLELGVKVLFSFTFNVILLIENLSFHKTGMYTIYFG
jgi:hypothetical protein